MNTTNMTILHHTIVTRLAKTFHAILIPLAEVTAIFLVAYFILLFAKVILTRLQRREVFTAAAVEHIHRLLALIVYSVAFVSSLYIVTNIQEIIYFFMMIFLVILAANWRIIASITAYYIMLLRREAYRTTLIDFPRLKLRGKIISTSLLYTKIRTPAGKIVYMPNYITISEPIIHLVNIQTTIKLEVELRKPPEKPATEFVQEVERKIQHRLDTEHLVTRAKDIIVRLIRASNEAFQFIVEVPVAGYEPRPATVNQIITVVSEELRDYNPVVRLTEQP